MAIDFTDDYDLFDGNAAVTVTGSAGEDAVANANKQSVMINEGGQWLVVADKCKFHLPAAELDNDPEMADTITEADATVWNITSMGYEPRTGKWEADCVKQRS